MHTRMHTTTCDISQHQQNWCRSFVPSTQGGVLDIVGDSVYLCQIHRCLALPKWANLRPIHRGRVEENDQAGGAEGAGVNPAAAIP